MRADEARQGGDDRSFVRIAGEIRCQHGSCGGGAVFGVVERIDVDDDAFGFGFDGNGGMARKNIDVEVLIG